MSMNVRARNRRLHWFITAGSVAGFLGGWVLLAQSPNPAAAAEPPAVVQPNTGSNTVPFSSRVPQLNNPPSNSLQPLPTAAPRFQFQPLRRSRLRTGGS
jgi:hypothetical protein